MADKAFTGLTAEVKVGETLLGYISGVDLTLDRSIVELMSFGSEWKEKMPAIKDWSASVDGVAAFDTASSQKTLYDAYEAGTVVTLGIYLDDTHFFSGSALVQSLNISGAPDEKIALKAEFAGSGAITLTVPAAQG